MSSQRTLITVLIPVYNEEENVERAYEAVTRVFASMANEYELDLVFTDNCSTDRTREKLVQLASRDPRVRAFRFSRNFGYQKSIMWGYCTARGEAAVQLDCDLQDPPEMIPEFLRLWRQGYKVVYGIRRTRQEPIRMQVARRLFYRLVESFSSDNLPRDAGDFRLVDRRLLQEIRSVDDARPYLRGLIASMGFTQVGVPYDRAARTQGTSKFPVRELLRLALDAFVNHSLLPLRLATFFGLTLAAGTLLAIVAFLTGKFLFGQDWPAGFATTTMLILFGISLNALFLGIIGEYLARIFLQVRRRPMVIIDEIIGQGGSASDRPAEGCAPDVGRDTGGPRDSTRTSSSP